LILHKRYFALARYMQGLVTDRLDMVAIYSRWFGFDGVLPYPREAVNAYYTGILYGVEWIPAGSEIYE